MARICFLCVRGKRQIVSSRLFLLLRHHLEHGWFGDFVPQNTKQIAFWYAWVILGCGIFGTMIGSFSNIVNARQDEHVAKKALSKAFRNKDKLRKAKISLNEGSTALVRNNSYLKFEIKERYIAFTKLIGL